MRFDCVLIDFDGTFTLAEPSGAPYLEAYKAGLGRRLGRELDAEWQAAEAWVREHPADYGWLHEGRIVAPGDADPYIRASTVARMLLDRFGLQADVEQRERLLSELYAENYELSLTVFRDGAREVLDRLLASDAAVYVVTNSNTQAVTKKLEKLIPDESRHPVVRGDARKAFVLDPAEPDEAFRRLPESQTLEGLGRPIYLRRGPYYQVLREIWNESGTTPERTLLVGDIYELDLAMPLHLGVSVHLVVAETTPEYERRFVERAERGAISDGLDGVLVRAGLGC
jgi:phosphoglycolate phosphatase-like HAD superfamily hydrolase